MNWNSHAPMQRKIDTLKNLVKRSIIISSDQPLLQKQLDYLMKGICRNKQLPIQDS